MASNTPLLIQRLTVVSSTRSTSATSWTVNSSVILSLLFSMADLPFFRHRLFPSAFRLSIRLGIRSGDWNDLFQSPGLHFLFARQNYTHSKVGKKTKGHADRVPAEDDLISEEGKGNCTSNHSSKSDEILHPGCSGSASQDAIRDPADNQTEEKGTESSDTHKKCSF